MINVIYICATVGLVWLFGMFTNNSVRLAYDMHNKSMDELVKTLECEYCVIENKKDIVDEIKKYMYL